jgi:hypothetical protein
VSADAPVNSGPRGNSNRVDATVPTVVAPKVDDKATVAEEQDGQSQSEFHPPFPDREELFLPPTDGSTEPKTGRPAESGVVLKGFANLDGSRALLTIDGKFVALKAGESRGDVKVISIDPPQVTFRQGNRRYTRTLRSDSTHRDDTSVPTPQEPEEPTPQELEEPAPQEQKEPAPQEQGDNGPSTTGQPRASATP